MLRSIFKGHKPSPLQSRADGRREEIQEGEEEQEEEGEEAGDSLASLPSGPSSASTSSSSMAPPKLLPRPSANRRQQRQNSMSFSDFSPISAADCFESAFQVQLEGQGSWRVYLTPPKPISGAGTRAPKAVAATKPARVETGPPIAPAPTRPTASSDPVLTSIELPCVASDEDEEAPPGAELSADPGTLFFFHHGAGYSGLSFALAAREVTRLTGGEAGVMAMDCRGHGRTTHPSSVSLPLDMSLDRLTQDCVQVLQALHPRPGQMPKLVLVGHSMGGSVVTALCSALQSLSPPVNVAGVAVLDVVEGTAMDALEGMRSIVLSHPQGFGSIEAGVRWHIDSGSIHNIQSARRSVPSLLMQNPKVKSGADGADVKCVEDESREELSEDGPSATQSKADEEASSSYPYLWRADLLATQEHWPGWFQGLSKRFLSVRTARLLLLAGTDRLDKELMVGQMQGKYQLTVFPEVGHSLQEDAPERTAQLLVEFWRRNEVIPGRMGFQLKKVGDA